MYLCMHIIITNKTEKKITNSNSPKFPPQTIGSFNLTITGSFISHFLPFPAPHGKDDDLHSQTM